MTDIFSSSTGGRRSILVLFLLLSISGFSQSRQSSYTKGSLYFYWGWNLDSYTRSDIHFKGEGYDFTLKDVAAADRQSPFEADVYLNPGTATIPQYNFRIGYFINDHYNISVGIDHMKYVMIQDQVVKISGHIDSAISYYGGDYHNENIQLKSDFLSYEHTDGLNYINAEIRRMDEVFHWRKISINLTEGIGAGILLPKTNAKLLENERHDEFHLSGFGVGAVAGLNITFFNHLYIQSEVKGGYINMPDVLTTASEKDKASQSFFFSQINILFGATFNLGNKD